MPKKNYRSNAGISFKEFLEEHHGETVRIGCKDGAGFVYAGKLGRFTIDAIRNTYGIDLALLPILDYYPSVFGGWIIIIPGTAHGFANTPEQLEIIPNLDDPPIEHYIRFADAIAGRAAENYKTALIGIVTGSDKSRSGYEKDIIEYEAFFRSGTFALICPNANGEEVISLIQKQARKEIEEIERRKEEREQRRNDRPFWHWVH